MELSEEQLELIKESLPVPRGGERIDHLRVLNAFLYRLENGCKWRRLPAHFGPWHTIYTRWKRWGENGTLERVFTQLQKKRLLEVKVRLLSLDSTVVKVHPDGMGALKKTGSNQSGKAGADGQAKCIWLPQVSG